ncbi:MAG: hypothetical protein QOF12_2475, partial [Solirubrobacteraceae bacterium]|nr:hypothetical protein [Solirubrobacteraceae bacterium]
MADRLAAALVMLALAGSAVPAQAAGTSAAGSASAPAATMPVAPATNPNALVRPTQLGVAPVAHRLTPRKAMAIARAVPKIRDMLARHRGWHAEAFEKGTTRWQVSYFAAGRQRREIGQVLIDDGSATVLEAWTGYQVAWSMARGYPGAFGRIVNSPWIWVPLSILFVVPFVNPRRWRQWLHVDLLVLSAFSISLAFFNHADIGMSVPLVYPPLIYLLIRMLTIARRRGPGPPLRLLVPVSWLAVATIFLIGFRIGLN